MTGNCAYFSHSAQFTQHAHEYLNPAIEPGFLVLVVSQTALLRECDMPRPIFIDNCAFDRLFELGIEPGDINGEEFQFYVTGEVLTEIDAIPDTAEKAEKKRWITRIARSEGVHESGYFGFAEDPSAYGFGQGFLADLDQVEFLVETTTELGPERPTGLPKNHTDRLLLSHAIIFAVLTDEARLGNGRLMELALKRGATVIRMRDFDSGVETFPEFLRRHFPAEGAS
jgi:hypothetical protein